MGYKVRIFCVGRAHLPYLREGIASYEKRLSGHCSFEWIILKTDAELKKKLIGVSYSCLDVLGVAHTSVSFSKLIEGNLWWNFVIGGAEGLTQSVVDGADRLISLSNLTFPHEMVRLMLIEQIYRALEISRGSPYHK